MEKDRPQQRPRSPSQSGSSPVLRPPSSIKQAEPLPEKKKRSPLERVVVWGLIGGLCFVAVLEYASKLSYDRAVNSLEGGLNTHTRANPFTVDAARALVNRPAKNVSVEGSGKEIWEWRWPSLFKYGKYRLRIVASPKTHVVSNLETAASLSSD